MANQQAKRDDNRIPGLLGHDESTDETRRITCTSAGRLNVEANLEVGSITIGDVKITDGTETANVTASNELNVLETNSAAILTAVQAIDTDVSTLITSNAAILTAVEILDNVVVTDNQTLIANPQILSVGGQYRSAAITYNSGDATLFLTDANGRMQVANTGTSKYENAAFGETEDEAEDSEFTSSVLYGYDSEGSTNSKLRAVQVAIDNIGISATPNVLIGGGIYKTANDTYDDNDAVPFHFNVSGALKVSTEEAQGTAPQAHGIDAAGADGYTTVVTAGAVRYHMSVSLQGANDAIVSIDSGTTESFFIPANSAHVFDNIIIANSATVQGKNASGGNNYTNLAITIW